MTSERYQRVKNVFQAAREQDASECSAFLDQACADDVELRSLVEALLLSDRKDSGFLGPQAIDLPGAQAAEAAEISVPAMDFAEGDPAPDSAEYLAGRRVGLYRILREIGHGGMGTVYLAERADGQYRKRVAIKLVNPHLGTEDILRRFRNERQVLAALDHPNIARLLDGGATEDGLPYLVMEYVEGVRIDTWCDSHKLPIRDRLNLFRKICAAVQYAHEKQVIHRDIKPGNILVTADGTPELLDFGIAKMLNPELSDSAETTIGPTPMTPGYASPEQWRGERVGPASDIYALGVVLYNTLTGQLPYSLQGADLRQMTQVICEQEPVKPSAAIQRAEPDAGWQGATATAETVSKSRSESPTSLRRQLAGDLDNIVLKALRKEPERRYSSVAQFSEDIDRFLRDLPVHARNETLPYRGFKFLKRNRVAATAAACTAGLALALSTGLHEFAGKPYEFPPDKSSIAVLPFVNRSAEKDQDYFADGLTDEVRNRLTAIRGLRVAGKASAMQFKGAGEDPRKIGKKLNVAAVLEGAVRKRGMQTKIGVQLIKADGTPLWSETFERDLKNVPSVKEEIARAVARALSITLQGGKTFAKSANAEAYKAYLQGHYFLEIGTQDNLAKAVGYLEQATKLDPAYAPAWVELGESRSNQAGSAYVPVEEGYRKAQEDLEKALALDPDLGETYAVLAAIKMYHQWDWRGADEYCKQALARAPGDAGVIRLAGSLARLLGRLDEAIALYRRAIEIDPIHPNAYKNLGINL